MSDHEETNVRLPPCALDALGVVAAKRRISRDEAVRQLLGEHVERQELREADDRLTHISTVLRYPPPPRWRGEPRMDRPLRLRVPPGLTGRARAVSLRLPGQAERAYRDYQGRLLTDAVMTAIAVEKPFVDEFLEYMLPLLRHRSALGLWRLAVAATSTVPEVFIQDAAEKARKLVPAPGTSLGDEEAAARRLLLVAEALDEEVSWHSPARFEVAANIARTMLRGLPVARTSEQLLYEQGAEWDATRRTLRQDGPARKQALRGLTSYDWTGRGGSAVWRAERRVEVQDFEDWLVKRTEVDSAEREVWPPGWLVHTPCSWHAHAVSLGINGLPEPYARWAAEGRVLTFPYGHRQGVWPLVRSNDQPRWEPVPGAEPLVSAAEGLRPDQVVGFIESVLVDWGAEYEDSTIHIALDLPADKAFDFGFITAEERRQSMAEARASTLKAMDDIIDGLPESQHHLRPQLEQAKSSASQFRGIIKRHRIKFPKFIAVRATWRWPGRSVVDALLAGTRSDLVEWLATRAHKTGTLILEQSMEEAWHQAFDRSSRRL
ncbi:CopG family transcriptional regulator [Streptomyces hirsutus]|uniref:ribbon-helix-helix domain-containing protein n=1 Tax=Streptomyces hirsutus TaxID=35620 RepID=UPI0033D830B6